MNNKTKKGFRQAVFVVVYKIHEGKLLYLILKRKKHWKGWEFPKGGVDPGENENATVRRECYEESGLRPIKVINHHIRGKYMYKRIFPDRTGFIGQTYHLYSVEVPEGKKVKIDKKEHYFYLWLDFRKAIGKLTHRNQKKCLAIVNRSLNYGKIR